MKKLMLIIAAVLVVGLLVPVACSRTVGTLPVEPSVMPAPVPAPALAPMPSGSREQEAFKAGAISPTGDERMIVRNGDMSLVVKDVVEARDEIARQAGRLGGFVVSSHISGEEEGMRGNISIRVPDNRFEEALSEFRNLAVRVKSESTSSRDVTEEYIDLNSRLKNAEATESQYLALLERAGEVEDILRIYDSLSRVRREIEQIKGRIQYLERTSSMSLISVHLEPEVSAKPLVSAGWSALEVLKSAGRGIITFGQWLLTAAIWLVIFSPVWGAIIGIIYWRRRKRRKAAA